MCSCAAQPVVRAADGDVDRIRPTVPRGRVSRRHAHPVWRCVCVVDLVGTDTASMAGIARQNTKNLKDLFERKAEDAAAAAE